MARRRRLLVQIVAERKMGKGLIVRLLALMCYYIGVMKEQSQPLDPFNFTEDEKRYDRISGERFWTLLGDEETVIHRVEVDSNDYGDFMFVTLSRPADDQRSLTTFCGMGYHKYRERWITDHWRWYQTSPRPQMLERQLTREEAEGLLRARQREIAPDAAKAT